MRYAITGITGTRNRGVEALLATTLEELRRRDPSAEVTVLTEDPRFDAHRLGSTGARFLDHALPFFAAGEAGLRGAVRLVLRRRAASWRRAVAALRDADVVVASGGDMFGSEYGLQSLERHLAVLRLACDLGRTVAFLGHSIGPFKTEAEAEQWRAVAERSALVTLRESLSYEYVATRLRVTRPQVLKTADVAFLLRPATNGSELLEGLGVRGDRPLVACAISRGISKYTGADASAHRDAWRRYVEALVSSLGAQVLLVPHVQDASPANDDAILGTELLRAISPAARASTRLAAGDYTAAEYKALIGRCDLVVAERMHAAIAGLSSAVATVVVGYSVKARGIVEDQLGSEAAGDGWLLPYDKFVEARDAVAAVERAFGRRAEAAATLRARRPAVEEAARANFDRLREVAGPAVATQARSNAR